MAARGFKGAQWQKKHYVFFKNQPADRGTQPQEYQVQPLILLPAETSQTHLPNSGDRSLSLSIQ